MKKKRKKSGCSCGEYEEARDCLEHQKRPAGINVEAYDDPFWISPYESCECHCHDKPERPLTQEEWDTLVNVFGR